MRPLGNQGYISSIAAVAVGMICSFLVVGSKVYLEHKTKAIGRVRESIQIQAVMEAAAKVVRSARDTSANPALFNWPPQDPECVLDCNTIFGSAPRVCFSNPAFPPIPAGSGPRIPGRPYCFFETPGTTFRNSAQLNLQMKTQDSLWQDSIIDQIARVLNLSKEPQWYLESPIGVSTAHATVQQSVAAHDMRADVAGVAPVQCDPAVVGVVPGCQICGGPNMGTADPVTCVNLELCPSTFQNCNGLGAPALFRQTVLLVPPGYQR